MKRVLAAMAVFIRTYFWMSFTKEKRHLKKTKLR